MKAIYILITVAFAQLTAWSQSGIEPSGKERAASPSIESQLLYNAEDADAWLELYRTRKESFYTGRYRTFTEENQRNLGEIVRMMKERVAGSYALEVVQYLESNKSDAGWVHLDKAAKMRPEDAELWDDMLCYSLIRQRSGEAVQYARQIANAGIFPDPVYSYSRNVLRSVEKDGILVTHGYRDTYPLLVLQYAFGERKDVRIICLEWAGSALFASQISALAGINLLPGEGYEWLKQLANSGAASQLYFALSIPPDELRRFEEKLYCTGLAMKFSEKPLANMESLSRNWEKLFDRQYLQSEEPLNRNYLVPLILLKNYYEAQGEESKSGEVSALAAQIAAMAGRMSLVKPYLD